jgi:hypothetical protein
MGFPCFLEFTLKGTNADDRVAETIEIKIPNRTFQQNRQLSALLRDPPQNIARSSGSTRGIEMG